MARIALLVAIAGDLRSAVLRGTLDGRTVHLDLAKSYRTGHVTIVGSFPGSELILVLCAGTLLSFM